jgi:hypothetical protein
MMQTLILTKTFLFLPSILGEQGDLWKLMEIYVTEFIKAYLKLLKVVLKRKEELVRNDLEVFSVFEL